MDNKPVEELVPAPKKRAPRKLNAKTITRKTNAKEVKDDIPDSFSTSMEEFANPQEEMSITCEYSDLVRNVDTEDWSPTKIAEPSGPNGFSHITSGLKTSISVENIANCEKENLIQKMENNGSPRFQENGRNDNDSNNGERYNGNSCYNSHLTSRQNLRNSRNENQYNRPENGEHLRHNNNIRNENQRDHNFRNNNSRDFQRNETNRNSNRNPQTNHQNLRRSTNPVRIGAFSIGYLRGLECLSHRSQIDSYFHSVVDFEQAPICLNEILGKSNDDLANFACSIDLDEASSRTKIIDNCMEIALSEKRPIIVKGILESMEGGDGIILYACDNYKIRAKSTFVPRCLIQSLGLRRGQTLTAFVHPPSQQSTCPFAIKIRDIFGKSPEEAAKFPLFKDLTPYYPTKRIFLESQNTVDCDGISMRVIDLLSPIGFGQRGLIVAPPRTGKTVLLQGIANSIIGNQPNAKLIVLLIDERPEEVTDFLRQVKGAEVISSTFDESSGSHIHAAEIVIENARRWVEAGEHVVVLLDSITRLARAYNTEQPNSGKILSGGVEANALQLPKRFFGSARNIEGGGSLTIIATALIETGSRMDDVIFEEFKGTGNMELHLDRSISDKRIFPAMNIERSGTRKEELLYHPDEMAKIYSLRRALQGIPPVDAIEMLVSRLKKCPTNVEFLMNMRMAN